MMMKERKNMKKNPLFGIENNFSVKIVMLYIHKESKQWLPKLTQKQNYETKTNIKFKWKWCMIIGQTSAQTK